MTIEINIDDLGDGQVVALLELHRTEMLKHSPPESVHALDVEAMKAPGVTFWSARYNDSFAGCGALKDLGNNCAELKSMKTADHYLRRGVAKALLLHILEQAKVHTFHSVYLETGTMDVFMPACTLYESVGFQRCGPFANYEDDPHSQFFVIEI